MKMKKILSVLLVGIITCSCITSIYALEESVQSRIMYVNEYTYEPSSTSKYNTYKSMGTVTLDNTGCSTSGSLSYETQYSGSATVSIGLSGSVQTEVDAVVAAVKTKTQLNVTETVTYTKGTAYSTTLTVPAGKHGSITGYIPAVKTEGRMRVDKYDYTSSDIHKVSTSYKTMSTSYVPIKGDTHFVNKTW